MNVIEIEGKNTEDAIALGLAQLGASRDQVEVEELQEAQGGFLGIGRKMARVRLTLIQSPEEIIRSIASRVFGYLEIPAEITVAWHETKREAEVSIETDSPGLILGRRGKTLDSLQYLIGALTNRRLDGKPIRLTLDIGEYRRKREKTLRHLADRVARDAVRSGKPAVLEPMPPKERRIIHMALKNRKDVKTHSDGAGSSRHVVVSPLQEAPARRNSSPRNAKKRPDRSGRSSRSSQKKSSLKDRPSLDELRTRGDVPQAWKPKEDSVTH